MFSIDPDSILALLANGLGITSAQLQDTVAEKVKGGAVFFLFFPITFLFPKSPDVLAAEGF